MTFASPFLDPQLDAPQPVTHTHPLAGAVIERAGQPLNPFSFPSDRHRVSRDALLVVIYSLVFAVPLAGVTVALHVFR